VSLLNYLFKIIFKNGKTSFPYQEAARRTKKVRRRNASVARVGQKGAIEPKERLYVESHPAQRKVTFA